MVQFQVDCTQFDFGLSKTQSNSKKHEIQSRFDLAVGAVRWAVVFGKGHQLKRVKRIFSTANILHSVFSSAALTEETKEDKEGKKG